MVAGIFWLLFKALLQLFKVRGSRWFLLVVSAAVTGAVHVTHSGSCALEEPLLLVVKGAQLCCKAFDGLRYKVWMSAVLPMRAEVIG